MYSYTYVTKKTDWEICIIINAEIKQFRDQTQCKKICDGIWFSVTDTPRTKGQTIIDEDTKNLIEGIKIIREKIVESSEYKDKTWIEIDSLQFSDCYFQEDALPIAMMYWAAQAFGFEMPSVDVTFDKTENKYLFKF